MPQIANVLFVKTILHYCVNPLQKNNLYFCKIIYFYCMILLSVIFDNILIFAPGRAFCTILTIHKLWCLTNTIFCKLHTKKISFLSVGKLPSETENSLKNRSKSPIKCWSQQRFCWLCTFLDHFWKVEDCIYYHAQICLHRKKLVP